MQSWIGKPLPAATFLRLEESGFKRINSQEFFAKQKVLLFGMPGAFTPTCNGKHLPSIVAEAKNLHQQGIQKLACVCMVDPFVMAAWSKQLDPEGFVTMLSDAPHGTFTRAMGLIVNLDNAGMGDRSKRYALLAQDGVVQSLEVEEKPTECSVSHASTVAKILQ